MFHERRISDKINKLHESALRIFYNDTVTSFENFLVKDKFLPGGDRSKYFVRNHHIYNLWSESELFLPNVNTVFKGQNIISYFRSVIWNSIPITFRKTSSYHIFRSEIKKMATSKLPLQIMRKLRIHQSLSYLVRYIVCCYFFISDFIHCFDSM